LHTALSTKKKRLDVSHYIVQPEGCQGFHVGRLPNQVTVTTTIIAFVAGDPYKPSFATVTGRGKIPSYICEMNA